MIDALSMSLAVTGPFTRGFLFFWIAMLVACISIWAYEVNTQSHNKKIEGIAYWVFGSAMVVFAFVRPMGIARDDLPYLGIYASICPTLECGAWIQGPRDVVWYSLVGVLKSIFATPDVMLWLSATAFLIKLFLFYKLIDRPMPVLLLYTGIFYQVQDLTAWRVSLSIAAFLFAIWMVARRNNIWNGWLLFVAGFFHKQAFLAPLIMIGFYIDKYRLLLVTACVLLLVLLSVGMFPNLHFIIDLMGDGFKQLAVSQKFEAHFFSGQIAKASVWPHAPIVVYPFVLLTLWLLFKSTLDQAGILPLLSGCLFVACVFLWVFATYPVVQVRLFEFFMVPTVILAGIRPLKRYEMIGVVMVSGLFVAKYNIVNQIFLQP